MNVKDKYGATALSFVSMMGYADAVQLLLNKGADVNVQDNYGETALMIASRNGYPDVVKLLLGKGADLNLKDKYGATAMKYASDSKTILPGEDSIREEYVDVVKLLKAADTVSDTARKRKQQPRKQRPRKK